MAASDKDDVKLRLDLLPKATRRAFDCLHREPWVSADGWYLAGGTALALQCGHRQSLDLDFFHSSAEFSLPVLTAKLEKLPWKATLLREATVYGELCEAKVSFVAYPYFVPKEEPVRAGSIPILRPRDIAVMKITAISQRGVKRDFYDLYWYATNIEPIEKLFPLLKTQYPSVAHNYHHILKSLTYFADAEDNPEPKMFFKATWASVKKFFEKEIRRVGPRLLEI